MGNHTKFSPISWLIIGLFVGLAVQFSQARFAGGWSGLIAVGADSPLLPTISQQLDSLVVLDGLGHDGQATFAVGLDPFLTDPPPEVPDAAYRYRRLLLPMLGSLFGLLTGPALLYGVTLLNLSGFVAAVAGTALLARERARSWLPLAALANLGLYLSLQTTTPDAFAMGWAMLAVAFASRNQHLSAALLAAGAGLTKETYVLVCLSLAWWAWRALGDRRAGFVYLLAAGPAALWTAYLALRVDVGLATGGNITWPFVGIIEGADRWSTVGGRELILTASVLVALTVSVIAVIRSREALWRYLIVPWILLALVSSHLIWDLGNNAMRALAPLLTFGILGLALASDQPNANRQHRSAAGVAEST